MLDYGGVPLPFPDRRCAKAISAYDVALGMRLTLVSPSLMDHVVPQVMRSNMVVIQEGFNRITAKFHPQLPATMDRITDAVPCGMSAEPLEEGLGRDDQVHALAALGPTSSKI